MYEQILLPTDGSKEMDVVIDHAVDLAAHHDAEIHTLYVLDTAAFGSLPLETSSEAVTSILEDEGEKALDAVEDAAGEITVHRTLVNGSPSQNIVDYADDQDIDIVVMGTHGRGGIDRLLLGSVAERVVRTSDAPVLTVRVATED